MTSATVRTATTTRPRPLNSDLAIVTQIQPVTVTEAAAVLADALQPLTNRQILDEVCYARGVAPHFGQHGDPWPLSKITAALAALTADGRAVMHQGGPYAVYRRADNEPIVGTYGSSPATRWYTRPELDTALRANCREFTAWQDARQIEVTAVAEALAPLTGSAFEQIRTDPNTGQIQIRLTAAQARALFPDQFGETS